MAWLNIDELEAALGRTRRTLRKWQRKGVAGFRLSGGRIYGDPAVISASAQNMKVGKGGRPRKGEDRPAESIPALGKVANTPGPNEEPADLGSLLDLDKLKSIVEAEPSGDIGDDIAACRRVRHRLQGIVEAWKPERLAEAPDQRQFLAFSCELTKTIARLGQLEGTRIALGKKNGELLTVEEGCAVVNETAARILGVFEGFLQSSIDGLSDELRAQGASEGVDFDVLGDVLADCILALRRKIADRIEASDPDIASAA